jgi:hypothetical protein
MSDDRTRYGVGQLIQVEFTGVFDCITFELHGVGIEADCTPKGLLTHVRLGDTLTLEGGSMGFVDIQK